MVKGFSYHVPNNAPSQASVVEPKQDELKKLSSLLSDVAAKPKEEPLSKRLKKLASLWSELISACITLISANSQLKGIAASGNASIQDFYSQDGVDKLKLIIALRRQLSTVSNKIESLAEDQKKDDPCGLDPFEEVFALQMPSAFESELSCESFDDLVADRASALENSLAEGKNLCEQCKRRGLRPIRCLMTCQAWSM